MENKGIEQFKASKEDTQKMEWISVTDKLPDTSGEVIVFIPTMDDEKPMTVMAWYELEGTGNMSGWQLLPLSFCRSITHWMPIPKPPTEKIVVTTPDKDIIEEKLPLIWTEKIPQEQVDKAIDSLKLAVGKDYDSPEWRAELIGVIYRLPNGDVNTIYF